jgi:hypothetical protein
MSEVKDIDMEKQMEDTSTPRKITVGYLDVIVITLIIALLTVFVYDRFFATRVVMVDLTGFVREQKELLARGKIDQAEVSANLARLQTYIKNQPKNLMVITKAVVLANGREIPLPVSGTDHPSSPKK